MLRFRLLIAIKCKCFFSCFRKEVAIDRLLQDPTGGGGGDGFEELEVVLPGDFLTGEMFFGAREPLVGGQRFWGKRWAAKLELGIFLPRPMINWR